MNTTREDYIPLSEEDIKHEREKLLHQARLQKSQMVRLLDDAGWQTFTSGLQAQVERRTIELFAMPHSADDVIQKTYIAGELAGIKIALDFPKVLIEYAQTSIDSAKFVEENRDGQETKPNADAGEQSDSGREPDFDNGELDLDATDRFYAGQLNRAP